MRKGSKDGPIVGGPGVGALPLEGVTPGNEREGMGSLQYRGPSMVLES